MATIEQIEILLEQKLEPIKKDISNLKDDISDLKDDVNNRFKDVNKKIDELVGYNKQDATGIEQEIGKIIKEHYRETQRKDAKFLIFPLKEFRDYSGNSITQFDYALIAYIDDNYDLIIVEAKHHITLIKVFKKIEQIYKLKKILENIKSDTYNDESYHKYYKDDIKTLKDNNFDFRMCKDILFYIGGPTWDHNVEEFINKINNISPENPVENIMMNTHGYKSRLNMKEKNEILNYLHGKIGTIIPEGTRYSIKDLSTFGGGKKYNKTYIMKSIT